MLVLLAEWLADHFYSGFNVFQYLTLRASWACSRRWASR